MAKTANGHFHYDLTTRTVRAGDVQPNDLYAIRADFAELLNALLQPASTAPANPHDAVQAAGAVLASAAAATAAAATAPAA